MANEEKIPDLVKEDPAQTVPPTQIILQREPIPNPDIDEEKKESKE